MGNLPFSHRQILTSLPPNDQLVCWALQYPCLALTCKSCFEIYSWNLVKPNE